MENKPSRMFLEKEDKKSIRYLKRKQSEEEAEKLLEQYLKDKGIPDDDMIVINEE